MSEGRVVAVLMALSLLLGCASDSPEPAPTGADEPRPSPEPPAPFDAGAFLEGRRSAPDLDAIPSRSPYGDPWTVKPVFPRLKFGEVVWAGRAPGRNDVLYVLEHKGFLSEARMTRKGGTRRRVLDVSSKVFHKHEAGAEGFAFHPDFADETAEGFGEVFLFYVTRDEGGLLDRLSRFRWKDDSIDPDSEEILIEQRHRWQIEGEWGEHFGGRLLFGPDGFLYVGVGDEGGKVGPDNAQRLDRNFFSGILRIDVDEDAARSHPPPRQPRDGRTAGYGIPNDNPFVGSPDTLEEFWAVGLRNPWGFSFDRRTGELWIGDVGQISAEEIDLGIAGGNYQWAYREGDIDRSDGARPDPYVGVEQLPLYTYPHGAGDSSVIGGAVYRGTEHEDLKGWYVFGDHGSGRIRTLLRSAGAALPVVEQIASVPRDHLLAISEGSDGELFILGRRPIGVSTLEKKPRAEGPLPPRLLSETGLFFDVPSLTPARGVLPYEINAPAYADGAAVRHWIALPGDGEDKRARGVRSQRIVVSRSGSWAFPVGTVFVQHLEASASQERETRLLVLADAGAVYGVTYRWTPDGRDAIRVDGEDQSCAECHNAAAGYVLGVHARQLSREIQLDSARPPEDQLSAWVRAGMLSGGPSRVSRVPPEQLRPGRLRHVDDETAPLEVRARSYLDVNCSSCHRGFGGSFSATIDTETSELLGRVPRNSFDIPDARLIVPGDPERSLIWRRLATHEAGLAMPPVGRTTVDDVGVQVVGDWIRSLR